MKSTNNILILCAYYTDSNNANGICAKNLAEEFVARGKNVWVISSCDNKMESCQINGVNLSFVEVENYVNTLKRFRQRKGVLNKLLFFFYRIYRNMFLLFTYPNNSPRRSKQVVSMASCLIEDNNIDTVIGTYRPYESLYTSIKLKKRFSNKLKVCTYHLDLLTINDEWKGVASKIMQIKAKRAFEYELESVDRILIPENYFDRIHLKHEKVLPVGFPLYIRRNTYDESDFHFSNEEISITYIGTLDNNNRNPKEALKIAEALSDAIHKKVVLHIWGRLWDSEICEIIKKSPYALYHESIENRYVQDILLKSDYLLNISNKVTCNFLPSKIFQYFALDKYIINIVQTPCDCSLNYFRKYKKSFNFYTYLDTSKQLIDLIQFLNKKEEHTLDYKTQTDSFLKFTPAFICDKIESSNARVFR